MAARGGRGNRLVLIKLVGGQRVPAEHVLLGQVIPRARAAHLHDEHLELTQSHRQDGELGQLSGLPGGLLEFIAVDVMHEGEIVAAADRTAVVGRLAVEPSCVFQVRGRVADLERRDSTVVHVTQHCPLL